MKLIVNVTCPDGIDDCDYALIDLTSDLARLALKRIGWLNTASDQDLWEMRCWDYHAEYFNPWLAKDAEEAERLAGMIEQLPAAGIDLFRAPNDFAIPENLGGRVECCQMLVRSDAIGFLAIPKHTDVYVDTAEIPLKLLEEAAAA